MSLNPERLRHRHLPRTRSTLRPQKLEPLLRANLVHDPFVATSVEPLAVVMAGGDSAKVGAEGAFEESDAALQSSQE